jgi:hypothetical protein
VTARGADPLLFSSLSYNCSVSGQPYFCMMEMSVTSPENWEKFLDTGDNKFLGDIDITSAPEGTAAVLSAEGLDRRIILGPR